MCNGVRWICVMECVYCPLRTGSLQFGISRLPLKDKSESTFLSNSPRFPKEPCFFFWKVQRLCPHAEAQVRSKVSPCEICGGQSVTGRCFSPSASVFPCQYHSTNAPYSVSSTCCFYQKDKRAKPGNLPKKSNALSEIGEHWIEK